MKTDINKTIIKDLPQTLILNKKASQNFSYDQKVTLYYCDALKRYFAITSGKNGYQINESEYSFIDTLSKIDDIEELSFDNGISLNINKECADYIIDLYNNLEEGKEEFDHYISESDTNFLRILEYSIKNGNNK